jgi:hypothetical protein
LWRNFSNGKSLASKKGKEKASACEGVTCPKPSLTDLRIEQILDIFPTHSKKIFFEHMLKIFSDF